MTNQINATAPTPQDWIDLVRENERLTKEVDRLTSELKAANQKLELHSKDNGGKAW